MATITLSGYVAADPTTRKAGTTDVLGFRVPVKSGWGDKETTTWYSVSIFGKRAESLGKIVRKGTYITVSGALSAREYEHNGEKRVSLDVESYFECLGPKTGSAAPSPALALPAGAIIPTQQDDEIPF